MNRLLFLLFLLFPSSRFAQQPDVVIFVVDDVADSDVDAINAGPWGLPSLTQLANQGVRMRRAYTHTWCAPTRDSMLRALTLGAAHGASWACAVPDSTSLELSDYSMVQVFKQLGYTTAYFGKWHLGVDEDGGDWRTTLKEAGYDSHWTVHPVPELCAPGFGLASVTNGVVSNTTMYLDAKMRDQFLAWWAATPGPKFALVNFLSAHSPFAWPPANLLPPGFQIGGAGTDNRSKYEAEILATDKLVGQMLAVVPPSAYRLFMGDNGTPGARAGGLLDADATRPDQDPFKVKLTAYEDGVNVPFILAGPGIKAGQEDHCTLLHAQDLLPTFRELLGGVGPAVEGVSLLSARRSSLFVWGSERLDNAVIGERWKLLTNQFGAEELYDLLNDPTEHDPLPAVGPHANALRTIRRGILGH